jgi:hypothetical protein
MDPSDKSLSFTARETVQAVTVPLLLISLGALFLLDYSGGPGVRKTWPILLIVWGGAWALMYAFSRQNESNGPSAR